MEKPIMTRIMVCPASATSFPPLTLTNKCAYSDPIDVYYNVVVRTMHHLSTCMPRPVVLNAC